MAQATRVLLFGDQTEDFVPKLRELLQLKDHPILTAFLEQSHFVVRAQMMQTLPPAEHKTSRTSELAQMLQKYVDGKLSPAFQTALSCITQIGCFMKDFNAAGKQYPQAQDSYVLGLCTGALAAAAVSSSSSLSELLPIAVQTVLISFRLGLCVTDMRDRLELSTEERNKSWSIVVNSSPERTAGAIAEFCKANVLPKTAHPWISAHAGGSTTVSGAPGVLAKLLAMPVFAKLKTRNIPIHVPAHNADMFSGKDVESILATTKDIPWTSYEAKLPFLSSVTGKLVWAGSYKSLMELSLRQILLEPIRWDVVEDVSPRLLTSRGAEQVRIVPVTTNAHKALSNALSKTISNVEVEDSVSSNESTNFSHRPGAGKGKLAIVSCSGRFPEAQSTDSFWDLLYKGLDVCKPVPDSRWPISTHVDPSGKARNKGATKWGCWLDFYAQFDPRFFSISPKEAPQMDPAQRMALMSTYEAMERGGIVPDTTSSTQRNRIGVFHGVTSNDWMETNTAQNIDTYFITGGNRGFIPGRINFCFEFSGPSYTNDTACSSSLAAIHLACNSLWRGDCDTAVAGGTNMIFTPDGHAGLDKGFFLSRTGNCKAFDDNADGYCRAEGVGTVFIKRLEDALADNDPILATILDTKTNHSAMSESMTRPFADAQIDNMQAVMNTAGVDPQTLSYLEMHGTGTQVGDAEEMKSVLTCFAPDEETRGKDNPLYVGSAKANVGHGEGVSGVTSLVKVLLMMQNNTIPPHCGIKPGSKINRNYPDLAARNVHIAFEPTDWPRGETARRVLINNFSAAGGNTALLLEDAPTRSLSNVPDPRTSHIVTVSGHVGKSLRSNQELLLSHLQKQKVSLSHLSYTTTARRWHHLHRVSFTGSSVDEITSKLQASIENGDGINRPKFKSKVVFAFTGQGSQYLGMGRQLYDAYPSFHDDIQRLDSLAQSQGFPSFIHVFTSTEAKFEEFLPAVMQLAITSLQMALANLIRSFGIEPSAVFGHSLGEYAALYTAGALSASDTVYLVGTRALLLQERCQRGSHSMLATKAAPNTLNKLIQGQNVEIACINGPEDTVLSGPVEAISTVQRDIAAEGIKHTLLKLPFAFHSAQVQPILGDFENQASGATFKSPEIPVISPLTKTVIDADGTLSPSYLSKHCRETVDMAGALKSANEKGVIDDKCITIEIGPKPLVCGMVKMTLGNQMVTLPTLTEKGDVWPNLQTIFSKLYTGGLDINWAAYHQPFESAKNVINLPSYGFDLKDYNIPYEGDWCLHRHKIHCDCADGDNQWQTSKYEPGKHSFESNVVVPGGLPAHQSSEQTPAKPVKPSKQDASKESYPQIETTTTVHRVVEETTEPLGATFIVETDISRKDVNSIAQGHRVDDIPLCTPSFYADIALQVGKYSMNRIKAGHQGAIDGLVDVSDLVVDKALIPHGQAPQLLRTTLTMSWPPKAAATTRSAKITFATYFDNGKLDTEHATCTVRFTTDAQQKSIQKQVPEYRTQIARLREGIKKGDYVKYNRKSGYKLMGQMAHFHPDYKLLDNLVLNEAENEATSIMDFSTASDGGTYAAHPAYVDSITQVAGFAMNANDDTDISEQVFVNHGWESFQVYQPLVKSKAYEVYTKMTRDKSGDLVHGDTIVLDGDNVAAFFRGLSLRCVPRKGLRAVLQSALDKGNRQRGGKPASKQTDGAAAAPQKPKAAPAPKQEKPAATAAPKPVQQPSKPAGDNDKKIKSALDLISEESGIALEELTDDSSFTDMGVDSLSSMVIGSRLREDLGLDLDPDFSLFASCPTVKSLKDFLAGSEGSAGDSSDAPQPASEEDADTSPVPPSATQEEPEPEAALPTANQKAASGESKVDKAVFTQALEIIADESGVAAEELTQDTNFGDVGIDSLSSMVISSRFREDLGLDLDSEFNLFAEVPTVAELATFLAGHGGGSSSDTTSEESGAEGSVSSQDEAGGSGNTTETEPDEVAADPMTDPYCRPCSSVILQGMPKVASKILFMLPDGGGSASSYAAIPRLKADASIVGLNCPYAREPEEMKCTWQAYIDSFVNEIQRRQPKGPYHLGGWSSGGAFAYVTAEALVNRGEQVDSLIIIDAPVPAVMEKLPYEFYEHCNKVGLFANQPGGTTDGAAPPPPYLIPHFQKTVDVMLDYKVAPLKTDHQPKVGIVWAAETVLDEKDAPKTKGMHFMIKKRTDFGPDGWDTVCPGAEFDIVKAEGGNHFTLMSKSHVRLVSDLIDRVIS